MQANVQHFRTACFSFSVEHIKRIFQVSEKLVAGVETLYGGKAHVVGIKCIGNDQLCLALNFDPIGQVIGIAV